MVSSSLAKPVFPAVSFRPTENFMASSFSLLHCSRLAVLSVVKRTQDVTEVKKQFTQGDLEDIFNSPWILLDVHPTIGVALKFVKLNMT